MSDESQLLAALGVRVIEVPDLGADGHYARDVRILLVASGLDQERREAVVRHVLPWAFAQVPA